MIRLKNCPKPAYEPGTIAYWLDKLPPGYRERAFANMERLGKYVTDREARRRVDTMDKALNDAFSWAKAPEPDRFWFQVVLCYNENPDSPQNLPPLPGGTT